MNNTVKYKYEVFGHKIVSSIQFKFSKIVAFADDEAEILISFGKCPEHLDNALDKRVNIEIGEEDLLLFIPNVAIYYIKNKNEIIIEKNSNSTENDIITFLFATVFGTLFHFKNTIPLHASCIAHKNYAIALCGNSGSGKSTLSAALSKKGYSIIADDLTIMDKTKNQNSVVYPGYPALQLWKDSVEKLEIDSCDYERSVSEKDKYWFPLKDKHYNSSLKLKKILYLNYYSSKEIGIKEIKGLNKMETFQKCVYRPYLNISPKRHKSTFKKTISALSPIVLKEIRYFHDISKISRIVELIESDLEA